MRQIVMLAVFIVISIFVVQGCMMGSGAGMMNHASSSGDVDSHEQDIVLKAVDKDYGLVATFAPLRLHDSNTISFSIDSAGKPISSSATARLICFEQPTGENTRLLIEDTVSVGTDGHGEFTFMPHQEVPHRLELSIVRIRDEPREISITLSTLLNPMPGGHQEHKSSPSNQSLLIGGIVMGTMMIAMVAWRLY